MGRGAIGIRIITESGESSQLGVGEWLTNSTKKTFINDSRYGDSYIKYDGTTSDLLDWYKLNNNDLLGGTFVIKAVALENDNIMKGDTNFDKVISVVDSTLVQKYIIGNTDFDGTQIYNADYDGDGIITVADATEIQKKVVGMQKSN